MSKVPTNCPCHMQLHVAKEIVLGCMIQEDGGPLNNVEMLLAIEEMRPLVHTIRYFQLFEFTVLNYQLFEKWQALALDHQAQINFDKFLSSKSLLFFNKFKVKIKGKCQINTK